ILVDQLYFAQQNLVLFEVLKQGLPRKLKHADGSMICPVPEIGIEMAEEPARGGLPCPPQVEAHLAQRFERRRQDGSYVIRLKSRHARLHGNRAAVNRENLLRQVAEPISRAS